MPLDTLLASLQPGGRDFEPLCKWALEKVYEYRQRLRHCLALGPVAGKVGPFDYLAVCSDDT